jgi:glutathione S-transferase
VSSEEYRMRANAYSAELAAAIEAGFVKNPYTGEHCHSLADAYMASLSENLLPEDIEEREAYDRLVRWSLEKSNASPGEIVATFNYIRVKAVRVAMKVAQRRGEVGEHEYLY